MSPFPRVERVRNDKSRRQDAGQAPSIPAQNGGALLFSVAVASRRSRCGIRHTQVGVYKPKGTTRIPLQDIPETMHIVPFCTSVKLDMDMSSLYLEELHLIAFPIWEAITGTAPNPQDFIPSAHTLGTTRVLGRCIPIRHAKARLRDSRTRPRKCSPGKAELTRLDSSVDRIVLRRFRRAKTRGRDRAGCGWHFPGDWNE